MSYDACNGGYFTNSDDEAVSGYPHAEYAYKLMPSGIMVRSAIVFNYSGIPQKKKIKGLPIFHYKNPYRLQSIFRPELKIPCFDFSTVFDWAYFFNMWEYWDCGNQHKRSIISALGDPNFFSVTDSVDIKDWDGLHYSDVQLFGYGGHQTAARNALFCAASFGAISVPFDIDRTMISLAERDPLISAMDINQEESIF